jgi:hypothetical protein
MGTFESAPALDAIFLKKWVSGERDYGFEEEIAIKARCFIAE